MVPSLSKAGFSLARFSIVASDRGDSSVSNQVLPLRLFSSIGTIWPLNRAVRMAQFGPAVAFDGQSILVFASYTPLAGDVLGGHTHMDFVEGVVSAATRTSTAGASFIRAPQRMELNQ